MRRGKASGGDRGRGGLVRKKQPKTRSRPRGLAPGVRDTRSAVGPLRAREPGSRRAFREILDGLDVGVAAATENGYLVYANSRFAEILGVSLHRQLAGSNLQRFVNANGWKALQTALEDALLAPAEGEMKVESSSGPPRTVRLSLTPMRGEAGAKIRILAADVTELVEATENLKTSKASLQSLSGRILGLQDEERRRIARDLHDVTGQKLAVAIMSLKHLAKSLGNREGDVGVIVADSIDSLRGVEREVRTLSYLLHPPTLDDLGLGSALNWYAEGIKKRSGLDVSLEIPEDLGRFGVEKEIALFRVVQEGVANVLRHSASLRARIRILKSTDQVQLLVEDDGKGIDPATFARLKDGREAVSLGIPGLRERLRQFGGKLELFSSATGTRVVASMPTGEREIAEKGTHPSQAAVQNREETGSATARLRTRILVVDDYEVIHHGIKALLAGEADLEVCGEARDGFEAIVKTRELNPDLIIMDLAMPNVGGISAAYQIRQSGSAAKVLIFTTHQFPGLEDMVKKSGCDGLVLKTDASADLIRAIRALSRGGQFFTAAS